MERDPSPPNPTIVFSLFTAYQRTHAIRAAIDVDLFAAIGEGATTVPTLAKRCGCAERGVRMLADAMVLLGVLRKEDGEYGLTSTAELFLDRQSPASFAPALDFLFSPTIAAGFAGLGEAVRRGGTALEAEGTLAPEHPVWIDFARGMSALALATATMMANVLDPDPAGAWRILDIAAGHGQFGVALAARQPGARVVALDWQNVLPVAKETAKAAGLEDRFSTIAGSAFDVDFRGPYDVILLTNILHHFDEPTNVRLLKKVHAALAPDGRAVTVEFVPNEDRTSPPDSAFFSLVMLATTPAGDAYTFAELDRMFTAAGFSSSELHSLAPTPQQALISRR